MKNGSRTGALTLVFSLSLLCVFAVCALLVVIMGARVYRSTAAAMTANYDVRTSVSYIAEKLRQHDTAGSVSVSQFGDGSALVLTEAVEGEDYSTVIYLSGGSLREIFARADAPLDPSTGQAIMPLAAFSATLEDGLLRVSVTDEDGSSLESSFHPRCG